MQAANDSQREGQQRNGIWDDRHMLLAAQVYAVALRALKPPGLHGQGYALAALHEIGEQPATQTEEHLYVHTEGQKDTKAEVPLHDQKQHPLPAAGFLLTAQNRLIRVLYYWMGGPCKRSLDPCEAVKMPRIQAALHGRSCQGT